MKNRKLTGSEAESYWRRTHAETRSDLGAVCFPGKSRLLNSFFDRIQTFALRRALDELGIGSEGARTLEIGCGRGRWLRFFRDREAHPTGVDISPEAVSECVEQGLDAIVASAEDLPFPADSFDLVVSVTVLLHLPPESQLRAASELERVCRPGGAVLLLEGTASDPSPHVWTRPASGWIALFGHCRSVFEESHYFGFPLRALWATPIERAPAAFRTLLENLAVGAAWPLEFALMRIRHGRTTPGALQTLLVLTKAPGH
jgi:SAM-dependent methyltransferase